MDQCDMAMGSKAEFLNSSTATWAVMHKGHSANPMIRKRPHESVDVSFSDRIWKSLIT